jgi:flagellar hook-basal body complex protein FliE
MAIEAVAMGLTNSLIGLGDNQEAYTKNAGGFGVGRASFQDYLVDALSYVNEKQQASAAITERLITDPDSVDVHDVTTAMAEAKMTMDIAQNVISRMITAWNEITTTR